MANLEHLKILKRGVKVWNQWREEDRLGFAGLWTYASSINLSYADLSGLNLSRVDFMAANLMDANLSNTKLTSARLPGANLKGANLTGASLERADLRYANLNGANLRHVLLSQTILSEADLKGAKGLDSCRHLSYSIIDHRTIIKSGKLPLNFLRGCGLPDTLIEYLPSLLNDPLQFYSCFISYSSKDHPFAERLHADLQNKGVRCWFAPEDLKIGDKIRDRIDESIRVRDKLLLILSEHSIASDWVEHEVESALEEERQRGRAILFPVRIDNTVMESNKAWAALIRRTRHIGDFTRWKEHDSYQKAFDRLLRDLKAEDKKP
jgi:uncharacterized protein YjbI with pentapeptide repeats